MLGGSPSPGFTDWPDVGAERAPSLPISETPSVPPRVPACLLFTRPALAGPHDDNFNATQKGLRSYLNTHTKLPWAQLSS